MTDKRNRWLDDKAKHISVHQRTTLFARTLSELKAKCDEYGGHGEAAVAEAQWGAITAWLMGLHNAGPDILTNPMPVAWEAVSLLRDDDRVRLGWPHHAGKQFVSLLPRLSPESADEARKVAAETHADWDRAGRPHLTPESIKREQSYIAAYIRNSEKEKGL